MKQSVRELILKRFRIKYLQGENGWVNAQTIEDIIHPLTGKKHETIGRQLRLMAEKGELEKQIMTMKIGGKESVWYKYVPQPKEILSLRMKQNGNK